MGIIQRMSNRLKNLVRRQNTRIQEEVGLKPRQKKREKGVKGVAKSAVIVSSVAVTVPLVATYHTGKIVKNHVIEKRNLKRLGGMAVKSQGYKYMLAYKIAKEIPYKKIAKITGKLAKQATITTYKLGKVGSKAIVHQYNKQNARRKNQPYIRDLGVTESPYPQQVNVQENNLQTEQVPEKEQAIEDVAKQQEQIQEQGQGQEQEQEQEQERMEPHERGGEIVREYKPEIDLQEQDITLDMFREEGLYDPTEEGDYKSSRQDKIISRLERGEQLDGNLTIREKSYSELNQYRGRGYHEPYIPYTEQEDRASYENSKEQQENFDIAEYVKQELEKENSTPAKKITQAEVLVKYDLPVIEPLKPLRN